MATPWRRFLAQTEKLPFTDGIWRYSRRPRRSEPRQGWKIHVSATVLSADEVFSRVHPILREYDIFFKVPAHPELLVALNSGLSDFSQIGKFLTAYPRSIVEATNLARELHHATRGLHGPRIPFDAHYRANSLVYYRYGVFRRTRSSSSTRGFIIDNKGRSHPDRCAPNRAVPRWLNDPFQKSLGNPRRSAPGPLGLDYLAFKVIAQRGKGGVYEALDLSVSPLRMVIIKEGRRHGETSWDGEDGYDRVRREARVLRSLGEAGVSVPRVLREWNQNGNHYLALEKIAGRPLISRKREQPGRPSWRRAARILEQLGGILEKVHEAGWVWRDCKPSHVFLHRGMLRLIDFEGACRIGETQVLPWGSLPYAPPHRRRMFCRRAGVREDDYALGVIAFQFTTGKFPSQILKSRAACYNRAKCPHDLREKIERLLKV